MAAMRRMVAIVVGAVVVTAALVSCSDGGGESQGTAKTSSTAPLYPVLNVTASEYRFDPGGVYPVPAGLLRVHLKNAGKENHQIQLVRLDDGVSLFQLQAAQAKG